MEEKNEKIHLPGWQEATCVVRPPLQVENLGAMPQGGHCHPRGSAFSLTSHARLL